MTKAEDKQRTVVAATALDTARQRFLIAWRMFVCLVPREVITEEYQVTGEAMKALANLAPEGVLTELASWED